MADNVAITAGAGTTIATDDAGGAQHQVVKLADGTADATTRIAAGEGVKANALRVALPTDASDVKVTLDSEAVVLGAGSEAIGKLAANDGVDIGNVDVASIAAGDNNIGNVDVVTVPAPLSTTGGGTEAAALRVTIANDSTGVVSVDDNGGALTVDGTVTAELSATDNAVLDAIAAAVATEGDALADGVLIQGDDGTDRTNVLVDTDGHLQVDVLSGGGGGTQYTEGDTDATITGTAMLIEGAGDALVVAPGTSADGLLVNLGTNNDVTIADGGGSITVDGTVTAELSATDNAVLDAIQTAVEKLDDAVAGSELQVDVVTSALPAGAATEATLAAVDGHVDGIETVLGTIDADTSALAGCVGGTELQVDVLTAPAVRALTNADVVTAELSAVDNAVLDTIDAVLDTIDADTSALAGCVGGTEVQVDVVSSALPTGAATDATLTDIHGHVDGIEGVLATIDSDTSALAGCVGGTELQVDVLTAPAVRALTNADVVTAELSATDNAVLDAIAASLALLDNSIAAGNELQCDIVGSLPAGTNAIGKLAANSGVDIGDVDVTSGPTGANALQVQGTVAHDSAAANNPLPMAGYAANAAPAAVANADIVRLIADLTGRLIVLPFAPPEKWENYCSAADITDTADDEVFAAVASVKHYITSITVTCSHATTGTYVVVKDGATVIWQAYCAAAGGGATIAFTRPLVGTANTAINVANLTNTSATRVSIAGFQAP